jgi:hypothetical protein
MSPLKKYIAFLSLSEGNYIFYICFISGFPQFLLNLELFIFIKYIFYKNNKLIYKNKIEYNNNNNII